MHVMILLFSADRRSEVAFKCVVHLLPAPPRKGVKKPRLSPDAAVGMFFQDIQVCYSTVI